MSLFCFGGSVIKKVILFYFLTNTCLSFASPVSNESLQLSGRALANYQICAQIAENIGDKTMHSYYSEMFKDSSAANRHYSQQQSQIISLEFNKSIVKLADIEQSIMAIICAKRFDLLTRKMQEKKLASN